MQEMRKVVFLDRDGVINSDPGTYTFKSEQVDIVEGVVEALKNLKKRGYEFVVITNQAGVAKGLYGHKEVREVHGFIKGFLADHGIAILDFYYCPHYDDFGKCLCRKPGSLLLEKAAARFRANKKQSYFIGDKQRDYDAGVAAGLNSILTKTNSDLRQYLDQIA